MALAELREPRAVTGVVVFDGETILRLGDRSVVVAGVPDDAAGRRCCAGLRALSWVRIEVGPSSVRCSVAGTTRRPFSGRVSLGAALALAASGVPTVVVEEAA